RGPLGRRPASPSPTSPQRSGPHGRRCWAAIRACSPAYGASRPPAACTLSEIDFCTKCTIVLGRHRRPGRCLLMTVPRVPSIQTICDAMTRQPKNEAFARTSFLQGANAAYIEQMQAQYERNPGSVSDEWRHFFSSLHEDAGARHRRGSGPSWSRQGERAEGENELLQALGGDWGGAERDIRDKLHARARSAGFDMSPIASVRAT